MRALSKALLGVAVSIMLTGCISAERRQVNADAHVLACAPEGATVTDAIACLRKRGIPGGQSNYGKNYYFSKCGPYWGWPFLASCESIVLTVENDVVVSSSASGQLDGP